MKSDISFLFASLEYMPGYIYLIILMICHELYFWRFFHEEIDLFDGCILAFLFPSNFHLQFAK